MRKKKISFLLYHLTGYSPTQVHLEYGHIHCREIHTDDWTILPISHSDTEGEREGAIAQSPVSRRPPSPNDLHQPRKR